jgi:hypothetical protein
MLILGNSILLFTLTSLLLKILNISNNSKEIQNFV